MGKRFDLDLKYEEIRERIYNEFKGISVSEWAEKIDVPEKMVYSFHPKKVKPDTRKPTLEYIIQVSTYTKKSVQYYLFGPKDLSKSSNLRRLSDKQRQVEETREGILDLFEDQDRQTARGIIVDMSNMAKEDPEALSKIKGALAAIKTAYPPKTGLPPTGTDGFLEKKS